MADRSVSVPMTSNELERRDARGNIIIIITALRQWLVPAGADESTTHLVPFLCPLCKLFYELVSCTINKINQADLLNNARTV